MPAAGFAMIRPFRLLSFAVGVFAAAGMSAPAVVQAADFVPRPETYICPNAAGPGAVNCFLDAVEHLYTMCRQIKSIEIIEFGYEKSEEGVNGAKTEYCVDKHKISMTRPYQAALREATGSRSAVDGLRALHELWLRALAELKWQPGESDDDYKARVVRPYAVFKESAETVRSALVTAKTRLAEQATKTKASAAPAAKGPN
jgi:hypothetical protein